MRLNLSAKNAYITSVPDPEFDGKNRLCGTGTPAPHTAPITL